MHNTHRQDLIVHIFFLLDISLLLLNIVGFCPLHKYLVLIIL